jgi:hypothetical protein
MNSGAGLITATSNGYANIITAASKGAKENVQNAGVVVATTGNAILRPIIILLVFLILIVGVVAIIYLFKSDKINLTKINSRKINQEENLLDQHIKNYIYSMI